MLSLLFSIKWELFGMQWKVKLNAGVPLSTLNKSALVSSVQLTIVERLTLRSCLCSSSEYIFSKPSAKTGMTLKQHVHGYVSRIPLSLYKQVIWFSWSAAHLIVYKQKMNKQKKCLDRWKQREWVQSPHALDRERERERERERQGARDSETETQTQREGDRQRQRDLLH